MVAAGRGTGTGLSRRGFGRLAAAGTGFLALGRPALAQAVPIRLLLDWRLEGLSALFLAAQEKGYFGAEGLDVVIEPGVGSRLVPSRIAAGEFDAGFGDINALVRLRDGKPGYDLKAVMMVHDRPPFAVIGRRSRGITAMPASLEGRKLGAPAADASFAQWPLFKTLNRIDDSRIRLETIGFAVREPMLASGEVDGIFGFGPSATAILTARGVPAEDIVVLTMADHGVVLYGNAVMVSPKLAADQPGAVRGLVRALIRGMREVSTHPDAAVQMLGRRSDAAQPEVERQRLAAMLQQNVLTPHVREHGLGGLDPARWQQALDQLAMVQPLRDRAKAGDAFTPAFLPAKEERLF
ncbi:ABC transporter substrate-binding protein [Bosea sp. TND4EK4]|uniref:ABC transporter substrate-binding protein n=1 Tax=Bosea sp. TND4EK4 TaxID=1907408 RepID=UPI000955BBC3|nr:ABC transporter substrate-binding protein [Bosea sp. TND4EK4]SIR24157.1 NitT/TauT family transport system substrate-binding protein [Bosea sp. TND4EK4]